jgi:hypothetical protein
MTEEALCRKPANSVAVMEMQTSEQAASPRSAVKTSMPLSTPARG